MSNPKLSVFNVKSFLKQRIAHEVYLEDIITSNSKSYSYHQEPLFYTKTYLKPNQKYPPKTKLAIPLGVLNHYKKRQYKAIYQIKDIDEEKCRVNAGLVGLDTNSFCKTNYLKWPTNIHVDYKTQKYELAIKILNLERNNANKKCNSTIKKSIRKLTIDYLNDPLLLKKYNEEPKKLILDILNKNLFKDLFLKLGPVNEFIKSIRVIKVELK